MLCVMVLINLLKAKGINFRRFNNFIRNLMKRKQARINNINKVKRRRSRGVLFSGVPDGSVTLAYFSSPGPRRR